MTVPADNPILLYDGVCGLCNRLLQFVLKRDCNDRFRFASLQSTFATRVLGRHGVSPTDLDTMYVVLDFGQPGERLLSRSDAGLLILRELKGLWKVGAILGSGIPHGIRNWLYNRVARNRYSVFGKFDACPLPDPKHSNKFLDGEQPAGNSE